jgi:hypothetical protein
MATARTQRLIASLTAVGVQARYKLEPGTLEDGERRVAVRALRWAQRQALSHAILYAATPPERERLIRAIVRDAIRALEGKD